MTKKNVLLFIFDGYADWETAYASVGITKSETHCIKTIALEKIPIASMGGMTIIPDLDFRPETDLTDIDEYSTSMLILPGGNGWERSENDELASLVRHCVQNRIPVAAICGATIFLANLGLLDHGAHTSNAGDYLSALSPAYCGHDHYKNIAVVSTEDIITAGGVHAVEFADAIFDALGIKDQTPVAQWFQYFQNKMVFC